jgi:RNA polymerase sigma-70 factor (ECF subfamily)
VRPWLFTVAHHIAIDAYRARAARPTEVGDAVLASIPAADEIDARLDRLLITDAMASLSAEHRAVLVETYYRGRSVAAAAEELGVPPGTVKSRTFYALRALKLALAERGVTT